MGPRSSLQVGSKLGLVADIVVPKMLEFSTWDSKTGSARTRWDPVTGPSPCYCVGH